MKLAAGFFIGMIVCLLLVFAVGYFTSVIRAEANPGNPDNPLDVANLLPDIGKIYRESLGSPYRQVKSEISDPDIASYYQVLMDRTGLDRIGAE